MDVAWALDELGAFVELATLVQPPPVPGIVDFTDNRRARGSQEALVAASHVVEQVLDRVIPDWRSTTPPNKRHRWEQMRDASEPSPVL